MTVRNIAVFLTAGLMAVLSLSETALPAVAAESEVSEATETETSETIETETSEADADDAKQSKADEAAPEIAVGTVYLALGADLKAAEKQTVYGLLEIDESTVSDEQLVTVDNAEEHQYLDAYLEKETIGTRALSSALIEKTGDGTGITVETKNIDFCTEGMYRNALETAGLSDARVRVAGPFPLSGTAALIGVVKAYAAMTDTELNVDALDAALNELVLTGELETAMPDVENVTVESFMAYLKEQYRIKNPRDDEAIRQLVLDAAAEFGLNLDEQFIDELVSLLKKVTVLDIDLSRFKEPIGQKASELAREAVDSLSQEGGASDNWFMRIIHAIVDFFKNLFKK